MVGRRGANEGEILSIMIFNERLSRVGGSEVYVDRQARALRALGHEVIGICAEDDAARTDSPFSARYEIPALFSAAFRPGSLRDTWRATQALRWILEMHRPQAALLHIFDSPIGLHAVQSRLPTLRFVHTAWTFCPAGTRWLRNSNRQCDISAGIRCLAVNRSEGCMVSSLGVPFTTKQSLRRSADMSLQGAYFRRSTLVCTNTTYSVREVARLSGRADNIVVLPPPVPPSTAERREPVRGRILFAGRITHDKGLADVVRALVHLPESHLVVAGDGPERTRVSQLVSELGLSERVQFLGWIDETGVDAAMQLASVVVLPSLCAETFGLVGMQAAMNQRPVVGYASGGIPDWLSAASGILVTPGDIVALAAAIGGLVRDPESAIRLGQTAYAGAQSFRPERHVERLQEFILEAGNRWKAAKEVR